MVRRDTDPGFSPIRVPSTIAVCKRPTLSGEGDAKDLSPEGKGYGKPWLHLATFLKVSDALGITN